MSEINYFRACWAGSAYRNEQYIPENRWKQVTNKYLHEPVLSVSTRLVNVSQFRMQVGSCRLPARVNLLSLCEHPYTWHISLELTDSFGNESVWQLVNKHRLPQSITSTTILSIAYVARDCTAPLIIEKQFIN